MKVAFTILGEPASKANSRQIVMMGRGKNARPAVIKSEKARDYEAAAMPQIPLEARLMLTGPVIVRMTIFYATERPDLDESVVLDVLQAKFAKVADGGALMRAGVYVNDRQVREKHIKHAIDRHNPRAEIEVEELQPTAALFEREPVVVAPRPRKPRNMPAALVPPIQPGADPF